MATFYSLQNIVFINQLPLNRSIIIYVIIDSKEMIPIELIMYLFTISILSDSSSFLTDIFQELTTILDPSTIVKGILIILYFPLYVNNYMIVF